MTNYNSYLQILMSLSSKCKYSKCYYSIITNALTRANSKKVAQSKIGYVERHHILPRAFKLGGDRDKLNYAYLSAREHFICHRLLAKIVDEKYRYSMLRSCWLMCHRHVSDNRYKITSRVYDILKASGPWNKGVKGIKGTPCPDKNKELYRTLYKNKKRSDIDKQRMKEGWAKKKAQGYQAWNKGLKTNIPSANAINCYFISEDGSKYRYESVRQGCLDLGLPTSTMCLVFKGRKIHYKGWSVVKATSVDQEQK